MRPRPVLTSNAIAGGVTGLAGVLAFLGYANAATDLSGEAQGIGGAIAFLVPTLIHLVTGGVAQSKVTPLADPMADDGTPLVKATTLAEVNARLLQAEVSLAPAPAAVPVPGANPGSVQPTVPDVASAIDPSAADSTPLPPAEVVPPS